MRLRSPGRRLLARRLREAAPLRPAPSPPIPARTCRSRESGPGPRPVCGERLAREGADTVNERRVSVVIPTRGRAAWCLEAVESARTQEGADVEVVVAMDGEQTDLRRSL